MYLGAKLAVQATSLKKVHLPRLFVFARMFLLYIIAHYSPFKNIPCLVHPPPVHCTKSPLRNKSNRVLDFAKNSSYKM